MNKRHPLIAVIDDDTAIIDVMREVLIEAEYSVIACCDNNEALLFVAKERPDVIILDLHMGKTAYGLEVIEKMRNNPIISRIPIILCTADGTFTGGNDVSNRQEYIVLAKPFDINTLVHVVQLSLSQ